MPNCPSCHSPRIWKDGIRYTGEGETQRYLCRDCGQHFSETTLRESIGNCSIGTEFNGSGMSDHVERIHTPSLKRKVNIPLNAIIGAPKPTEAKNLAEATPRIENRAAGATKPTAKEVRGKIIDHLWRLKNQGYKESTIEFRGRLLRTLVKRGAKLLDPETVKETIAKMDGCIEDTKAQYVIAYDTFASMAEIPWNPPRYKQTEKLPFIPTEAEIDQLIAACHLKTGALLQMLKETAMRIGEAWQLKWTEIDFERQVIRLNLPEKRSKARIFNVSSKLIGMLGRLQRKSERVFGHQNLQSKKRNFRTSRKRIAANLQNPRILQITFHTFRHWKATMLYHQTKDLLFVKEFLGHRRIDNTLKYVQLDKALFDTEKDEFHVKVARTLDEACKLLEAGFDYVTDMEEGKIFRKRK